MTTTTTNPEAEDPAVHPDRFFKVTTSPDRVVDCLRYRYKIPPGSEGKVPKKALTDLYASNSYQGGLPFWWKRQDGAEIRCFLTFTSIYIDKKLKEYLEEQKKLRNAKVKTAVKTGTLDDKPQLEIKKVDLMAVANLDKLVGKCIVTVAESRPNDSFEFGVLCVNKTGEVNGANTGTPLPFENAKEADIRCKSIGLKSDEQMSVAVMRIDRLI